MNRHPHILNASTNLLGICLAIITALRLTHFSARSLGDELAWLAALMFLLSIVNSFIVLRSEKQRRWQAVAADWVFLTGVGLLTLATVVVGLAAR